MAKKTEQAGAGNARFKSWQDEITKALKRFRTFHEDGDATVDAYRQERADNNRIISKDNFNILYSSTETIRPNLYAQRPTVYVKRRSVDRAGQTALDATLLLEGNIKYCVDEFCDFDGVMESAVEDLLLPGLGTAWVRYEPTFGEQKGPDGKPILGEDGKPLQEKVGEKVFTEYTYWKDFITGFGRTWDTLPWIARRWYMTKTEATKRFGAEKANKMSFTAKGGSSETDKSRDDDPSPQAEGWEIWDKINKRAYWYCDSYVEDLLDVQDDPLQLRNFFPCPKPLRAISNTRTFIPKGLYSVYKPQAEQLNSLTKRIRLLTEALRVVGMYDGATLELATILNPTLGNKMVKVDNWASFMQQGGMKGSVEWLPLVDVVNALQQLLTAREVCKNEIYEITGFSDIVRGVSKASETLGAQNIKANWAGARVKKTQKDVQRFARDLLALIGEVISEHFDLATMVEYSGLDIPSPEQLEADPAKKAEAAQFLERFKAAHELLRNEGRRCAIVDIETDSTIMADEQIERQDRTAFMASAASFLQQAVPAMQVAPQLGELLGALLMFGVRTFPTARPVEEAFMRLQQEISGGGMQMNDPKAKEGGGDKGAGAAQTAQIKGQTDMQLQQGEASIAAADRTSEEQIAAAKLDFEREKENNRHAEAMRKLEIEGGKLAITQQSEQREDAMAVVDAQRQDNQQQHQQSLDVRGAERDDTQLNHSMSIAEKEANKPPAKPGS